MLRLARSLGFICLCGLALTLSCGSDGDSDDGGGGARLLPQAAVAARELRELVGQPGERPAQAEQPVARQGLRAPEATPAMLVPMDQPEQLVTPTVAPTPLPMLPCKNTS